MSKFFINRPIVAMVIAILTVIVGAITILGLPITQFPNIVPQQELLTAAQDTDRLSKIPSRQALFYRYSSREK
jgi:hypothetical protein